MARAVFPACACLAGSLLWDVGSVQGLEARCLTRACSSSCCPAAPKAAHTRRCPCCSELSVQLVERPVLLSVRGFECWMPSVGTPGPAVLRSAPQAGGVSPPAAGACLFPQSRSGAPQPSSWCPSDGLDLTAHCPASALLPSCVVLGAEYDQAGTPSWGGGRCAGSRQEGRRHRNSPGLAEPL